MSTPVLLGAAGVVLFLFGFGTYGLLLLLLGVGLWGYRTFVTA